MSEAIRVLIADDHTLLRRGLAVVLDTEDDIEVVGEASDGAEALHKAQELAPDVVILDVRMPDTDGLTACAAIKRSVPDTKVIMLHLQRRGDRPVRGGQVRRLRVPAQKRAAAYHPGRPARRPAR